MKPCQLPDNYVVTCCQMACCTNHSASSHKLAGMKMRDSEGIRSEPQRRNSVQGSLRTAAGPIV